MKNKKILIFILIFMMLFSNFNVFALNYNLRDYYLNDYSKHKIINSEEELKNYIINQDRERKNDFKILYMVQYTSENVDKLSAVLDTMYNNDNKNTLTLFIFRTVSIAIRNANYEGKNVIEIIFQPNVQDSSTLINEKNYTVIDSIEEYEEFMSKRVLSFEEHANAIINIPLTTNNYIEVEELIKGFKSDIATNDAYMAYIVSGRSWSIGSVMLNGEYVIKAEMGFSYTDFYKNQTVEDKRIKEILSQIITDKMYAHEKVRAIHDYIVKNYKYDTGFNNYYIKEMLDEGKGVCQAYSLLTYKMLKLSNIPVKYITGMADNGSGYGSHAWNMVNLGGYWFNLDVTWDDPIPDVKGRVLHDYYMLTDKEFYKDHTPSNEYTYPSAYKSYEEYINEFTKNESKLIKNKTTDGVNIKIRDSYVDFTSTGQAPVNVAGRTLVPIRAVFEQLGYEVKYDAKTSTATISDGKTTILIVSNNDIALINGIKKKLDVNATVLNSRILVPVRFISEAFNNIVIWDAENNTVIIH